MGLVRRACGQAWLLVFLGLPFAGAGELPRIAFDMAPVLACTDVTSSHFAEVHPDERLIEVRWQVSVLLQRGREEDLSQLFFRLETMEPSVRVEDYSPHTTLASDQAGNVSLEERKERTRGAGVTVSGFDWPAKISGSGDIGSKRSDSIRYELVPEMKPVTASGTIQGGSGVYFKLRASRSTSLEGAHPLSVTLRVPAVWRGGCLQLTATAWAVRSGLLGGLRSEPAVCGRRRFLVALHREGDVAGKTRACRLVDAKSHLLQAVSEHGEAIEKRFYPTVAHRVGVLLDVLPPRLPGDWSVQWIFGDDGHLDGELLERMPSPVREAMTQYVLARRELVRPSRDAVY